jgi:hypothetical protein
MHQMVFLGFSDRGLFEVAVAMMRPLLEGRLVDITNMPKLD